MNEEYLLAPLGETKEARDRVQLRVYSAFKQNIFFSHFAAGTVQSPLKIARHHTLQYCLSEWMKQERQPHAAYLNQTPILVLAFNSKQTREEKTNRVTNVLQGYDSSFRHCISALHQQYVKRAMRNGTDSKGIRDVMHVVARGAVQIPKWVLFDRAQWRLLLETNGIGYGTNNTHGKYSLRPFLDGLEVSLLSEDERAARLANAVLSRDKMRPLTPNDADIMDSAVDGAVHEYLKRMFTSWDESVSPKSLEDLDKEAESKSGQRIF